MVAMASHITGVWSIWSNVCSSADQIKYQSSAPLIFVRGNHRLPVDSHHKGPVTRRMFPFDDVIMSTGITAVSNVKPRQPQQWDASTRRIGPRGMENKLPEWTDQSEIRLKIKIWFSLKTTASYETHPSFSFPIGFAERKTILAA